MTTSTTSADHCPKKIIPYSVIIYLCFPCDQRSLTNIHEAKKDSDMLVIVIVLVLHINIRHYTLLSLEDCVYKGL